MGGEAAGRSAIGWQRLLRRRGDAAHGEGGAAYLARRRHEREAREAARALAAQIVDDVDGALRALAVDDGPCCSRRRTASCPATPATWCSTRAYLVDADAVAELRAHAASCRSATRSYGARVHLSGPWPPYNFVRGRAGEPTRVSTRIAEQDVALVDLVDRVLGGGVVIAGDITLAVADVDLVHVSLRALDQLGREARGGPQLG